MWECWTDAIKVIKDVEVSSQPRGWSTCQEILSICRMLNHCDWKLEWCFTGTNILADLLAIHSLSYSVSVLVDEFTLGELPSSFVPMAQAEKLAALL